jgi:hypothetical protein
MRRSALGTLRSLKTIAYRRRRSLRRTEKLNAADRPEHVSHPVARKRIIEGPCLRAISIPLAHHLRVKRALAAEFNNGRLQHPTIDRDDASVLAAVHGAAPLRWLLGVAASRAARASAYSARMILLICLQSSKVVGSRGCGAIRRMDHGHRVDTPFLAFAAIHAARRSVRLMREGPVRSCCPSLSASTP